MWLRIDLQLDLPGAGERVHITGRSVEVLRQLDALHVHDGVACIQGRHWSIVRSAVSPRSYEVFRDGRRMFSVAF